MFSLQPVFPLRISRREAFLRKHKINLSLCLHNLQAHYKDFFEWRCKTIHSFPCYYVYSIELHALFALNSRKGDLWYPVRRRLWGSRAALKAKVKRPGIEPRICGHSSCNLLTIMTELKCIFNNLIPYCAKSCEY